MADQQLEELAPFDQERGGPLGHLDDVEEFAARARRARRSASSRIGSEYARRLDGHETVRTMTVSAAETGDQMKTTADVPTTTVATAAPGAWEADEAGIYFSDYFGVHPDVLEQYGALDISVVADMPLFIDPFLLFNSDKPEYKALHQQILEYLRFLRDHADANLERGLVKAWYAFKEVRQNWLGFTEGGNAGHGLGMNFAHSLHLALGDVLGSLGDETITESSHLEKVSLIRTGVGRDSISDFTTNLIKHYLLTYTETFAVSNLSAEQTRQVQVARSVFNYNTETWAARSYTLPWLDGGVDAAGKDLPGDYVILTPLDLLTKDDTWINRSDMLARYDRLPEAVDDLEQRAQINRYFARALGSSTKAEDIAAARAATIKAFPELVDYYIALKENDRDRASAVSIEKTRDTQAVLRDQVQATARDLQAKTNIFDQPWTSYDEARDAVMIFKHYVEHQDGYTVVNRGQGKPFASEKEVQAFFGLLFQRSRFDVNREPNNGRGPVDYKVSMGALDTTLIEFKLASNSALKRNLKNQVEVYLKANKTDKAVKVVIVYKGSEAAKVARVFKQIDHELGLPPGTTEQRVVVIDARADNKPSASNV